MANASPFSACLGNTTRAGSGNIIPATKSHTPTSEPTHPLSSLVDGNASDTPPVRHDEDLTDAAGILTKHLDRRRTNSVLPRISVSDTHGGDPIVRGPTFHMGADRTFGCHAKRGGRVGTRALSRLAQQAAPLVLERLEETLTLMHSFMLLPDCPTSEKMSPSMKCSAAIPPALGPSR